MNVHERRKQQDRELLFPTSMEIFPGVRTESSVMILDFREIPTDTSPTQDIRHFFEMQEAIGENPRLPEHRQRFNDAFGHRYLLGRYGEDRSAMLDGSQIAKEGRVFHLGIDIFTADLALIHAPYSGVVIRAGQELGMHTYGYYLIVEHRVRAENVYVFYGHLSAKLPAVGTHVRAGSAFAQLGDFVNNENGGWSRHVHVQLLQTLPSENETPIGYSTLDKLPENRLKFPDPNGILQIPQL